MVAVSVKFRVRFRIRVRIKFRLRVRIRVRVKFRVRVRVRVGFRVRVRIRVRVKFTVMLRIRVRVKFTVMFRIRTWVRHNVTTVCSHPIPPKKSLSSRIKSRQYFTLRIGTPVKVFYYLVPFRLERGLESLLSNDSSPMEITLRIQSSPCRN